ncbi:MAG: response regulator, partial [Thermodesulfobacteriota bacterium]|nr:response regulator [Thermodesulfobacteriota bacterium]
MGKKIMSVDDSSSMRQIVCFTLKGAGYDVIEAVDGNDALAKLKNNTVDMVITDLYMPNKTGIELIQTMRLDPAF